MLRGTGRCTSITSCELCREEKALTFGLASKKLKEVSVLPRLRSSSEVKPRVRSGPRFWLAILTFLLTPSLALAASDTIVVRWNAAALQGVRDSRIGPPMVARALAIVHTCIFDAWAAYDRRAVGTHLAADLRRPKKHPTLST